MANTILPLDTAATIIAKAVKADIERAIQDAIHSHIDPLIKAIAAQKAEEVCDRARVAMQRDVVNYDRLHVLIQFNGETFVDKDLG